MTNDPIVAPVAAKRWLTVRQVADELGVTPQTVYNWVAAGKVEAVRVGRTIRLDPDALPGRNKTVESLLKVVDNVDTGAQAVIDSVIAAVAKGDLTPERGRELLGVEPARTPLRVVE